MQLKKIMKRSSPEKREPTKKLSKQERKLMSLVNQYQKKKENQEKQHKKQVLKASKKFEKEKQKYIKFLKANDMWNDELERKYNNSKKKKSHLLMDNFVEGYATRIARSRVNKKLLKNKKSRYGDDKKRNYEFYVELVNLTEEICRVNGWMTKEEMDKHNVPIDEYMRLLVKAATEYSEVLIYYAKQWYDDRRDKHMG